MRCQRVAIRRRAFRDTEWRELCEAYERWVRREIASNRHLEKATNVLETAMAQRQDRAERILAAKPPDSGAGKGAAGRLGLLVELREILRAALEEGA